MAAPCLTACFWSTRSALAECRNLCRPSHAHLARRPLCRQTLLVRAATTIPSQFKTVKPVGERVLVKVDSSEDKSVGGILLPSSAQKRPTQGEITEAPGASAVKSGDKVVYSKYAGTEVSLEGHDFVLLKEEDVIALMKSDDVAKMQPLGDRVLIEVVEADAKTTGGVLLTEGSKERPTLGRVVAAGSGKKDDKGKVVKPAVNAGDNVLYSKYAGTEFEGTDGKSYVVVRDSDILGVVS